MPCTFFHHHLFATFFCLFLVLTTACVPTFESHGFILEKKALEKVEIGMTKSQVEDLMGAPTSISYVDGQDWYYIWAKYKMETYHMPTLVDQFLINMSFDKKNCLVSLNFSDKSQFSPTPLSHQKTTIYGRQAGSLEQFLSSSRLGKKSS